MKYKKLLFALLIILLIPVVVLAENISIKEVKLVEYNGFVEEKNNPIYGGLNINFDLKFGKVGDSAKYKVIINNKENENYFLELGVNNNSDYITYEVSSEKNTNVVKANSDTSIYLIVKYNKEVPASKLVDNKYSETKDVGIRLTNNRNEEVIADGSTKNAVINPETGNIVLRINNTNIAISLYMVIIILVIAIILIVILKKLKIKRYLNMIIILGMILIPSLVYALKIVTINVTSKIEIEKLYSFTIYEITDKFNPDDYNEKVYYFKEGMNFIDWLDSEYNTDEISVIDALNYQGQCIKGYILIKYEHLFNTSAHETVCDSSAALCAINTDYLPVKLRAPITDEEKYVLYNENCLGRFYVADTFNGDETTYMYEFGMTWEEWLDSEYNVNNLHFDEYAPALISRFLNILIKNNSGDAIEIPEGQIPPYVKYSDLIEFETNYAYIVMFVPGNGVPGSTNS